MRTKWIVLAATSVVTTMTIHLAPPAEHVPATTAIRPVSFEASTAPVPCAPASHCAPTQSQQAFQAFFAYVVQIPDDILNQGDAATSKWIGQHPRSGNGNQRMFMSSFAPSAANPYRCTLAVAGLLVTTGLPALKILKIKKAIEGLGGVAQAARLVVGATSAAEKSQAVLSALGQLLGVLLGITAVQQWCFS